MGRSVVVPIPFYPPEVRKAKHAEIARGLRATQKAKGEARAAQKEKESAEKIGLVGKKQTRSDLEVEAGVDDVEMATQA